MKFGLYTVPTTNLLLRCIDGEFAWIHPNCNSRKHPGTVEHWQAILDAPCTPAREDALDKLAISGSLLTYTRAIAKLLYSVPDDVELYERGAWGEEKEITGEPLTVREICAAADLTQAALAARFGIPKRTVEDWCAGKRSCAPYIRRMMMECLGRLEK